MKAHRFGRDARLRFGLLCLLALGLVWTSGGGCYWVVTSDDDCDDDFDDDDLDDDLDDDDFDDDCFDDDDDSLANQPPGSFPREPGAPPGEFELAEYRATPSTLPGGHPWQTISEIHGLSLSQQLGPAIHGKDSFRIFTAGVIAANPGLVGLPSGSGRLRFADLQATSTGYTAIWEQESLARDGRTLPGGAIFFLFDPFGSLQRIENRTVIAASGSR